MLQIVEQTYKQKVKMYKKVSKKKLIKMLIQCNKMIAEMQPTVVTVDPFICGTTLTRSIIK